MADDDVRDDATLADTLGAFGTRPLLEGPPESDDAPSDPTSEWHAEEPPRQPDESRLERLVAWVRWAAAPLGFFVFLSALTAYGVLRDRDGGSVSPEPPAVAGEPAAVSTPPVTEPITVPPTTVPTTVPSAPTTVAGPSPAPPPTSPPEAATDPPEVTATTVATSRFRPVCGYTPGQPVIVSVNGRPAGEVAADARGCVSPPE